MTDPFLILHKVRGEPAFDIAIKMDCPICKDQEIDGEDAFECSECDDGFWWIIPTSGHRAYPYWTEALANIELSGFPVMTVIDYIHDELMPSPWPDHYPSRSGDAPKIDLSSVVAALAPQEPVERRF